MGATGISRPCPRAVPCIQVIAGHAFGPCRAHTGWPARLRARICVERVIASHAFGPCCAHTCAMSVYRLQVGARAMAVRWAGSLAGFMPCCRCVLVVLCFDLAPISFCCRGMSMFSLIYLNGLLGVVAGWESVPPCIATGWELESHRAVS